MMADIHKRPSLPAQKSLSSNSIPTGDYTRIPSRPEVKKSRSFASIRTMSIAKSSRAKSVQASRIGVPSSAVYNPSDHYVPCMYDGCQTHYLISMLSPSFYEPSKPNGLVNKLGLCPSHALKDRQNAEANLKTEHARLRATAGRRTLREVEQLFEQHVRDMIRSREIESKALLRSQEVILHAKDFKYYQRPCTAENCRRPWYSIYAASIFKAYDSMDEYGICMLTVYCPRCASAEMEEAHHKIEETKKWSKSEDEFEKFLDELKQRRAVQVEFWEKARVRVMLKKGVKPKTILQENLATNEDKLEGKGVEFVREACVVM